MKAIQIIAGLIVVLAVCALVSAPLFGWHVVDANHQAVATRYGSVIGTRDEGVHIDLFSNYTTYDLRVQTHVSNQAAATRDLQDISMDVTITYQIRESSVLDIFNNVGSQEAIESNILNPLVSQYVKQVSTQYGGEELIQKREEVSNVIEEALTVELGDKYSLDVKDVSLTNMTFTNVDFNAAIDQKQIAEQKALEAQFDLERVTLEAEQQRVQQETLTDSILRKMWIEKWNGVLPTYVGDSEGIILSPQK